MKMKKTKNWINEFFASDEIEFIWFACLASIIGFAFVNEVSESEQLTVALYIWLGNAVLGIFTLFLVRFCDSRPNKKTVLSLLAIIVLPNTFYYIHTLGIVCVSIYDVFAHIVDNTGDKLTKGVYNYWEKNARKGK